MALNLSLTSITQSNDSTILRVVDNTGVYSAITNIGGWNAPNTLLSTVNGTTTSLTLTLTYTNSSGIETEYEPIDIYDYLGHTLSSIDDLLIYITPALLFETGSTNPIGDVDDAMKDGWYSIKYEAETIATSTVIDNYTIQIVLDGVVRNRIYDTLISIPRTTYESTPSKVSVYNWNELTYPIYVLSLFEAMVAYVTPARKNDILEMLNLIERLTS